MISRLRNQSETMQFPLRQRRLGTVAAVIEVVNELESSVFPSLHHLNSFTSSSPAAKVGRLLLPPNSSPMPVRDAQKRRCNRYREVQIGGIPMPIAGQQEPRLQQKCDCFPQTQMDFSLLEPARSESTCSFRRQ